MNRTKRLLISMLTLLCCYSGTWALDQDVDGYYLIGSVQDWKDFAAIVNDGTNTAANAKMVADVDLGNDQTNIVPGWFGDFSERHYHGTFDGQGHTLTVHYSSTSARLAPFGQTSGATIKNLHVAGSIALNWTSGAPHASGIIANSAGNDVISNVWVSADITASGGNPLDCGVFVGCNNCGTTTIKDCLFTGTLTTTNQSRNGCFVGLVYKGTTTITNCLSTGSFSLYGSGNSVEVGTIINSYVKQHTASIPAAMQLTDEEMANGAIAFKLQAGRKDLVWGQRIGIDDMPLLTNDESYRVYRTLNGGYTNDPTQGYPGLQQDEDDYYLIGTAQDWDDFAAIVNDGINTAANARMTADIDLGDDQTYISPNWHGEFSGQHYHGTFDGQGHTLTVHYNSSKNWHTPFSQTSGATIKNLHVAGTIKSTSPNPSHMSGLVSNSAGSDVIQNIWVSADITGGSHSWIECGAFVGCNNCGNTTITDCLFTGSITTTGGNNGCFAGYNQGYQNSTITTTNCLSTGAFHFTSGTVSVGTIINSYVKSYPNSIPTAMQLIDAQLTEGTITAKLQAGREEEVWVQDPLTNQPMLKVFMTNGIKGDVNGDGIVDVADIASVIDCMSGNGKVSKERADVNGDGTVDVADIAAIIDIMAGK